MRKIFTAITILLVSLSVFAGKPKYVFYFIGDGMGTNQVLMTEFYQASLKGEMGPSPLCFTQFPVATVMTHYATNRNVTDSPASGTALATGVKTKNGFVGLDSDGNPVKNLAEIAKESGKKVAIVTTSDANDATPAAFFSHQPSRTWGYEIMQEMIAHGYEFYGGAGLRNENRTHDRQPADPIRPQFEAAGYTICDPAGFRSGYKDMQKVLMIPLEGQAVTYSIDTVNDLPENRNAHLTFSDFVSSALTFLMRDNPKKGFFMMAEAGEIDHACHSRDAATLVQEVIDFDEGIRLAYDFYLKHPKETLIIVAADHETGGLTFAPRMPEDLAKLRVQKHSMNRLSDRLKERMVSQKAILSWEEIKTYLSQELGLWKEVEISWEDEKMLRDIYEVTIARRDPGSAKDLYADNSKIVSAAVGVLNKACGITWSSKSHTSGYVPVFAIGAGSERFTCRMDNALLAQRIREVAF